MFVLLAFLLFFAKTTRFFLQHPSRVYCRSHVQLGRTPLLYSSTNQTGQISTSTPKICPIQNETFQEQFEQDLSNSPIGIGIPYSTMYRIWVCKGYKDFLGSIQSVLLDISWKAIRFMYGVFTYIYYTSISQI